MEFYIVDAFTEQIFGGNPAGVVILPEGSDYPPDDIMRKTAAELRYSETAFVREVESGKFQLRYFTPTEEVELCGHATIASFSAMLSEKKLEEEGDYTAITAAGELKISIKDKIIMMDMAHPEAIRKINRREDLKELYEAMGFDKNGEGVSLEGQWNLYPEVISTGLPDIILPLQNKEALDKMVPDYPALVKLSVKFGVVGVHAFALGEGLLSGVCCEDACDLSQVTAYCRNFAPAVGICEEAATGTANGALIYYLYKNALIDDGTSCRFLQGESMGRPSIILGSMDLSENGPEIRVGGFGVVLVKGDIFIS